QRGAVEVGAGDIRGVLGGDLHALGADRRVAMEERKEIILRRRGESDVGLADRIGLRKANSKSEAADVADAGGVEQGLRGEGIEVALCGVGDLQTHIYKILRSD